MLMLTHTYLLQNVLSAKEIRHDDLDIFVYNIVPDLLTINPDISSRRTHIITRFPQIPDRYPKAAYVMFHLLVDDLTHYGSICQNVPDEFNPDAQGYSHIKGKPLITSLLEFHDSIREEITFDDAAYRSHLVIEMIYDLVILDQIKHDQTIELLAAAIHVTIENKMSEFIGTINWLYDLDEEEIRNVMNKAAVYLTAERMNKIMNIEGRIRLYGDKVGLPYHDPLHYSGIKKLFSEARDLLDGNDIFLTQTAKAIKDYGWLPPSHNLFNKA